MISSSSLVVKQERVDKDLKHVPYGLCLETMNGEFL